MELKALYCPNCGGSLDFDLTGRDTVFCPYCGQQLWLEDGGTKIQITNRIIDEADVIRATAEANQSEGMQRFKAAHEARLERARIREAAKVEKARAAAEKARIEAEKERQEYESMKKIMPWIVIFCIALFLFMLIGMRP